jgi:hypothetical protein
VFLYGEILNKERNSGKKYPLIGGVWEIFCKENHFSEEKSPELSQVGRPSTAHPCRGWRGGFEQTTQYIMSFEILMVF